MGKQGDDSIWILSVPLGLCLFWYHVAKHIYRAACWELEQVSATTPDAIRIKNEDVSIEFVTRKKSLVTAYTLCFLSGLFGTHHFYLDRLGHGFASLWTLNYFFIGWFVDLYRMPIYVSQHNQGTAPKAASDRGCHRLICRAPWAIIVAFICLFLAGFKGPRVVHMVGVMDIDKHIAQTSENPFDILGVKRGINTDDPDIGVAYKERMSIYQRNCDEKCRDLKRAVAFVKANWRNDWAFTIIMEYTAVMEYSGIAGLFAGLVSDASKADDESWTKFFYNLGTGIANEFTKPRKT